MPQDLLRHIGRYNYDSKHVALPGYPPLPRPKVERDLSREQSPEVIKDILKEMGFECLRSMPCESKYSWHYFKSVWWNKHSGYLAVIEEYDRSVSGQIYGQIRPCDCFIRPSGASSSPHNLPSGDYINTFNYTLEYGVRGALEVLSEHTEPLWVIQPASYLKDLLTKEQWDNILSPIVRSDAVAACNITISDPEVYEPINLKELLEQEGHTVTTLKDGFLSTTSRAGYVRYWWTADCSLKGLRYSHLGSLRSAKLARKKITRILKAIEGLKPKSFERIGTEYQWSNKLCFTPQVGPYANRPCRVVLNKDWVEVQDYVTKEVLLS